MALNDPATIIKNNDLVRRRNRHQGRGDEGQPWLIKMWDSFDLNKDGKVDAAEIRRAQPF